MYCLIAKNKGSQSFDVRVRDRQLTEQLLEHSPKLLETCDLFKLVPASVEEKTVVVTTFKKVIV